MKNFIKPLAEKIFFVKDEGLKSSFSLDRVIKKLIYLLVILIPLWFLPSTLNVVDFNKQTLAVFLTTIIFVFWLVKALNQGEISWKKSFLNIIIALFLISYIVSSFFSLRFYSSLVGYPTHLSGALINIFVFVMLYILILNNFKGLKDVFNLLFAFLISSAIVTLIGLIQIWGGFIFPWDFSKLTSFNMVGSANALGIFSTVILILISTLLFVIKKNEIKIFLIALGFLNFVILLSLNYWLLWLILAIGMIIVLFFGLIKLVELNEKIGWLSLPMAFLAISLIFMIFKPSLPFGANLPIEVGLTQKGGLYIIKESFIDNPILGNGPENFFINYAKYKPENTNQTVFWNVRFSNSSNEVYSLISDLGILGTLSFMAILIFFIIKAIKNLLKTTREEKNILKRFVEIGLFASWFGLATAWFFYPQNFTLMFVFWLLLALYLAESSAFKEKKYNLKNSSKVLLLTSFSFVIVMVVVVGLFYIQGTRFIAEIKYKNGLDLIQKQGELNKGINKLINSTTINPYEDRIYNTLSQLFILKMNQDAYLSELDQQQRLQLIQADAINAINSAVRATTLAPQNVSNWIIRGQVYQQTIGFINGAEDWAESSFSKAVELEPKNPFVFVQWGKVYTTKADILASQEKSTKTEINEYLEKALEKFNQAVSIKPDYASAHFEIALIFERQGKLREAIAKMELNREIVPSDIGVAFQLGSLYYKAERYKEAKSEFIRAVALDSDFANARYFLGLLYDREGDRESAIDQFQRILENNPGNEQVEAIINNLKAGKPALGSPELGPPDQPEEIPIEESIE